MTGATIERLIRMKDRTTDRADRDALSEACRAMEGSVRNAAILEAIHLIAEKRNALPPGREFKLYNELMGDLDEMRRKRGPIIGDTP